MEGQVEGQALVTSMETSEMGFFLVLDWEDVLPTLVLGQQGGPDLIGHQVQVQAPRQQEDQHRPQPDGQEALHQPEDQALVETSEDQNLVASEEMVELDLTDCQDLASEMAIDQVDWVDKVDKVDK